MDLDALRSTAAAWIADDPDPATRDELAAVVDGLPATAADLADRLAGPLRFGTAGLRGPVRAGPHGMNLAVVRAAARGLVTHLDTLGHPGPVVIGYDGRRGSAEFAAETARVCTGAGRRALLLPRRLPTPVLAYAVRRLGAAAGVMVTASHNPPADNGYKVYLSDGAQLAPPHDAEIEAAIRAVGPLAEVPLGEPGEVLGEDVVRAYVADVAALADPDSPRDLTVAYTALHGVGGDLAAQVFERAGFDAPVPVGTQQEPDPEFPTVAFPNPEEPGAMDLVRELAALTGAHLAVAHDPDADRCAVAVPDPARGTPDDPAAWRILTGDETGILLADHLLARGARGTVATTIVSSSMLRAVAARYGVPYAETLTGFKWIARAADDLVYGYEEALGYAVAPSLVRDKDGISAGLLMAELAASLRARGSSLLERLDALAAEHGVYATAPLTVRVTDPRVIADAMARLRADAPASLLGRPVTLAEPAPDVVVLRGEGVRAVVRPSGTEPKLKAYLEAVVPVTGPDGVPAARAEASDLLERLRGEISETLCLNG
ncbi:MAG TPA: phospho-sugar mutase [Mycobacteriales bacterium]|jgi:phosphomannomutase|nr:phospho-sugar mutase [Mycobacteriales bacterium]